MSTEQNIYGNIIVSLHSKVYSRRGYDADCKSIQLRTRSRLEISIEQSAFMYAEAQHQLLRRDDDNSMTRVVRLD